MIYPDKIGEYCKTHFPNHVGPLGPICLINRGDGPTIERWPEELGKPPTPEEVEAWRPTLPVDQKAELAAAMEAAKSGTAATKATAAVDAIEKLNARVAELEKRLGL